MTRSNRVAMLVVAVAIAVVAFLVLRPSDEASTDSDRSSSPAETAQPAATKTPSSTDATPTPTPKPKPKPKVPLLSGTKVRELEVKQGQTVRFAARSPRDDEIHVHGYDRSMEAPAGQTVRMSFKATITGIFEIEFENAGTPIGELKVEP